MEAWTMTPIVRFKEVRKCFGPLVVLDSLSLEIMQGEKVVLIGPSGSGKSTILRILMTLETISAGEVEIQGEPLWHMERNGRLVPANERHLRRMRSAIGMVFQQFNLFPHMTALGNVADPTKTVLGISPQEATLRAEELLSQVGLRDKLHFYPSQLSGGQQQRVAIARAPTASFSWKAVASSRKGSRSRFSETPLREDPRLRQIRARDVIALSGQDGEPRPPIRPRWRVDERGCVGPYHAASPPDAPQGSKTKKRSLVNDAHLHTPAPGV
jgi:predicted ABC-type transport system involved in lysophospholipase L1 biosynthesis ATPase subunit